MQGGSVAFDYFWKSHPALLDAFVRESGDYRKLTAAGGTPEAALAQLKGDRAFMAALRKSKTRLEAGFTAMDPATGAVRVWVGSRDFAREQFDHVSQAARQPGHLQAIVYGAALEKGLSPDHVYRDEGWISRRRRHEMAPADMSGTTGRDMTMRDGLVYSKNTITAQVMQDVGLPPIIKLARALGIRDSKLEKVPSLALGTSPVTLLEMVNAYASIAAQGEARLPFVVTHITDREGKVIARFGEDKPQRAMQAASAATLTDMMRGVIDRGTARPSAAARHPLRVAEERPPQTLRCGSSDAPVTGGGAWVGSTTPRHHAQQLRGQGGHNAVRWWATLQEARHGQAVARRAFPAESRTAARPWNRSRKPEANREEPGLRQEGGAGAAGPCGRRRWRAGVAWEGGAGACTCACASSRTAAGASAAGISVAAMANSTIAKNDHDLTEAHAAPDTR